MKIDGVKHMLNWSYLFGDDPARRPNSSALFCNPAHKYRLLLGLGREARVLAVGQGFHELAHQFQDAGHPTHFVRNADEAAILPAASSELILLDWKVSAGRLGASSVACDLSALLSDRGSVVAAGRTTVARLAYWKLAKMLSLPTRTPRYACLDQRVFVDAPQFHATPSPFAADVFESISAISAKVTAHGREPLGPRGNADCRRNVIFASANPDSGIRTVPRAVEVELALPYGTAAIDRFEFRQRGALIVVLSDGGRTNGYVGRLAADDEVASVLSQNEIATSRLLRAQIPESQRALVPKTVSSFEFLTGKAFIEQRLEGVLGWTVATTAEVERRLFSDARVFQTHVDRATRRECHVDTQVFKQIVGASVDVVRHACMSDPGALRDTTIIESMLKSALIGRTVPLVYAHGDFGYGNLLCNGESGLLTGVIDWDTHIECELPGVDLCNLVVQHDAALSHISVSRQLREFFRTCDIDQRFAGYPLHAGADGSPDWRLLCCLVALRIVARAARYPVEFAQAYAINRSVLRAGAQVASMEVS